MLIDLQDHLLQCCSDDIQCSGSSSLVVVGAVCGGERGETQRHVS